MNPFGKNWKTSVFGCLAALPLVMHQMGFHIGHLGGGDWLDLINAVGVAGIGLAGKDKNVTGGTIQQ